MYVHGTAGPAVLFVPGLRRLYANRAGERVIEAPEGEALVCRVAAEVVRGRDTLVTDIGGVDFSFAPLFDDNGAVDGVIVVPVPPTALPRILNAMQESTRNFSQLVHVLPAIVMTARPGGAIDFLNERWYERTAQRRSSGSPAHSFESGIVPADRGTVLASWADGCTRGEPFAFELRLNTPVGPRWFELRAEASLAAERIVKWVAALHDIDDEVRVRTLLGRSERQLRIVADVSRALAAATDPRAIGRAVIGAVAPDVTWAVMLGERGENFQLVHPAEDEPLVPLLATLRDGDSRAAQTRLDDGRVALVVRSAHDDGGAIAIVTHGDPDLLWAEWIPVLREVSLRVDVALDRAAAFERERVIADTLQRAMLPTAMPQVEGVVFDVAYTTAARERLAGGDWYDAFDLGDRRIGITIGDVTGHGLDAAIVMSRLRQIMRAASLENRAPEHVLGAANRVLFAGGDTLASAFYGVLDTVCMRLNYASAGHPPPVLVGRTGELRFLAAQGVLLGVTPQGGVRAGEAEIAPDSALVLYTDGVIEAGHDLVAGEQALIQAVSGWARSGFAWSAVELQERTVGERPQSDDAAMLVVRFPPAGRLSVALPASAENAQRLRRAFARFLCERTADRPEAYDATLAVAEAVNNAVLHAYGDAPGEVRLAARRVGDDVVASVRDGGVWPGEAPVVTTGHGLDIMGKLAPGVQIRRGPRGSTVSFRFPLPQPVEA
jgi:anti-sigma regulatory factor (Ser/Thr protein kinase)/PAS domain-containing protein